jgi:hypothetical protein
MTNKPRIGAGLTVFALGVVLVTSSAINLIGSSASALSAADSQPVTVRWVDVHPDSTSVNVDVLEGLTFTVDQTAHLGHQGITVSWDGGVPTSPSEYGSNYVQLMQCWGDDSEPTPQQCQWGAPTSTLTNLVGSSVASRSVSTSDPLFIADDNADLHIPGEPSTSFAYPFTNVRGESVWDYFPVFSSATTNEITAARTGLDGTGSVTFEVQTSLEAPHLGCGGEIVQSDGSSYPRGCWLVIVPRGDRDPNGDFAEDGIPPRITQSPLSPSNWADRIVVPLSFEPVSQSCALGQAERRLVGSEVIADAFTSWQSGLCSSGTTYGFSMLGDSEARTQIVSTVTGASRLALISNPLSTTQSTGRIILYAPVVRSAIVFAYNIDYDVFSDADPEVVEKNGTRLHNLVLNQRLVAKLLTQSYQVDNPGFGDGDSVIENNPTSIVTDPEFVALNPDFDRWNTAYPPGLMVGIGSADAYRDVWRWVRSSPEAVAFLGGAPDDDGMLINPEYVPLDLGGEVIPTSFPKTDLSTFVSTSDPNEPGFGTLDMRPYFNDMQETAYRTLRGDGNDKSNWDSVKTPPGYKAWPAQQPGRRFTLSITTLSAAARYGLDVARITNVNGDIVSASEDAINTAISHFVASGVPGVLVSNPAGEEADIYPLAQVVYAAIDVCSIDDRTAADYRKLLTYVAGDGQYQGATRGMLPNGYIPLSDDERKKTKALGTSLKDLAIAKTGCPVSTTTTTSTDPAPETTVPSPSPSSSAPPTAPTMGPTADHLNWTTSIAGFGFITGVPMCAVGPLMISRARRFRRNS